MSTPFCKQANKINTHNTEGNYEQPWNYRCKSKWIIFLSQTMKKKKKEWSSENQSITKSAYSCISTNRCKTDTPWKDCVHCIQWWTLTSALTLEVDRGETADQTDWQFMGLYKNHAAYTTKKNKFPQDSMKEFEPIPSQKLALWLWSDGSMALVSWLV